MSFENDTDEEIDTTVTEEEEEKDWIEYLLRSTDEGHRKDEKCEDSMLEQDSQKNWRLALRIATSPSERWLMKATGWNPELSSKYRTNRAIGRPRKRWEDDINEFLKLVEDETENFTESSSQINKNWINTAEDRRRWTLLEEKYTITAEERHENNANMRRNTQSRPARYVNGVYTVINRVYVLTLLTEQGTTAFTDSFSRGLDPSLTPVRPGR